jgi:hypothetical protein
MRKQKWNWIIGMLALCLTSCVQETIVINDPLITDADVYFEYTADNWGAVVEGDIYNDGEIYIEAIQLEIRLFDRRGIIMDYEYVWVDTYFNPGGTAGFYLELPHRGVYEVDVFISGYD